MLMRCDARPLLIRDRVVGCCSRSRSSISSVRGAFSVGQPGCCNSGQDAEMK